MGAQGRCCVPDIGAQLAGKLIDARGHLTELTCPKCRVRFGRGPATTRQDPFWGTAVRIQHQVRVGQSPGRIPESKQPGPA